MEKKKLQQKEHTLKKAFEKSIFAIWKYNAFYYFS